MKSMNFRRIFFLGVLIGLGVATAARAQFAVYGTVSAERLKSVSCIDPQGNCAAGDGTARPYGGSFGAYYDFRSFGPVRIGADLRGTFLNSNKSAFSYSGGADFVRHYAGLGGARASFNTPFKVLRPYVQISAGFGKSNATSLSPVVFQNFTQVQGFAGLDLAVFSNVDIRAIEFGAGELFGSGSHSIQTIGLGVVFHTTREK
jgi:hypothetical protein